MKKIILIVLISLILAYGIYLGLQKRFYQIISHETLVGMVRCARSPDKNYDFYLFYFPVTKDEQADFLFAKFKGRDWLFEGELIKWKKPLNVLGFKTAHRPVRIYDSAETSYVLEAKSEKLIFKLAKSLPVVDTSFISIVKQPYIPKIKFGIYATNTGYLVRRIK